MNEKLQVGRARRIGRAGFTLIELLIVIGIIGVLSGIVLVVGKHVTSGSKETATREVILALDQVLAEYIAANDGSIPAPYVEDPRAIAVNQNKFWPVADGYRDTQAPDAAGVVRPLNSVGFFLLQCKDIAASQKTIQGIPAKFVHQFTPEGNDDNDPANQPLLPTVFDAWGNPIRYVHPAFDGVRVAPSPRPANSRGGGITVTDVANLPRRTAAPAPTSVVLKIRRNAIGSAEGAAWSGGGVSTGDSDGGVCPGKRPYFYSAGADGNPSTIEDNVYTTRPQTRVK